MPSARAFLSFWTYTRSKKVNHFLAELNSKIFYHAGPRNGYFVASGLAISKRGKSRRGNGGISEWEMFP